MKCYFNVPLYYRHRIGTKKINFFLNFHELHQVWNDYKFTTHNLTEYTWDNMGANADTLRSSALALVLSTAG